MQSRPAQADDPTSTEEAWLAVQRILNQSFVSQSVLMQKLADRAFSLEAAEAACAKAIEFGLINDEEYARQMVRRQIAKGYGRRRIEQVLYTKGIDPELTQQAIAEQMDDGDELEGATDRLAKWSRGKDLSDAKVRNKAYAHLMRRGYDSQTVNQALNTVTAGE